MGELVSTSRVFSAEGSEGLDRGIRMRNCALLRKLPFGDRWQSLRIGLVFNVETFGIVRDTQQPGTNFFVGVCSGPWSIGDHHQRTFRACGLNLIGTNANPVDFASSWNVTAVSGQNAWNNSANNRGLFYYVYTTAGSYATGGVPTTRTVATATPQSANGQMAIPDSSGLARRTAAVIDLYRSPYLTAWNFKWTCTAINDPNLALDIPPKSYLQSLGHQASGTSDPWYNLALPTIGTSTATTALPDTRNAPLDYLDIYWDSYTMGLELWRVDVIRLS